MKNAPANPGFFLLSPTPHAVWHTKRRKPCSFIAAMMLAEPTETGPFGFPGLSGRSGLLGCREPRTLITASLPATASRTFSGLKASPTTTLSRWWRAHPGGIPDESGNYVPFRDRPLHETPGAARRSEDHQPHGRTPYCPPSQATARKCI